MMNYFQLADIYNIFWTVQQVDIFNYLNKQFRDSLCCSRWQ